jgi:hypothetical protein
MNTEQPKKPGMSEAQKRANRNYYRRRYESDADFRKEESERNGKIVMKKYNEDPEYKLKMQRNALDRYYRLKAEKQAQAQK